jgi:hypothetical protein
VRGAEQAGFHLKLVAKEQLNMLTRNEAVIGLGRFWLGAWLVCWFVTANSLTAASPPGAGLTPVSPSRPPLAAVEPRPQIQVTEPNHDFGKIQSGEQRTHEFVIANVGTAPLEITQVRTSCGCTTTKDWDRRIEPGATGKIPVRFDTGSFSGTIQRNVTLVTNDPQQSQVVMQVKAQIWVPVEVTPKTVMFQYDPDASESETRVVRLVSNLDKPLRFREVRSTHPSFAVELETVEPDREFALQIRTVPPIGTGMVTALVLLQPSDPDLAPIQVVTYAMERLAFTVSPARLLLPNRSTPAGARPSVTIRNNTGQPMQLTDPQINVPDATVDLIELQPDRVYRLTPVFPDGFELPTGEQLELTVKSNLPRHPEIRIPVLASSTVVRTPTTRPTVVPRTNVVLQPVARPREAPAPARPPIPQSR